MPRKPDELLQNQQVEKLAILVEEGARSSQAGVKRFIEPAQGTLSRAVSKRHHLVFGRRGSGKSSLLRKAAADLTIARRPIAYVDLEPFKAHSYPDVLLSVLIKTFQEFERWLKTAATYPSTKTSFWQKLFGTTPVRKGYDRKGVHLLTSRIQDQILQLETQLYSDDNALLETTKRSTASTATDTSASAGADIPRLLKVGSNLSAKESAESVQESKEQSKRSKTDFLHRHIITYQGIFRDLGEICDGDSYLFLDDLYHIRRSDQPNVIDYFHRMAKGNNLWLKIGTIRHRTRWYLNGDPPIGLKTGDDADEIDLDLTLEKFDLTKSFLVSVLEGFINDCKDLDLEQILNEGATDRLVLASGGVARDFLAIFRRAIDVARQRGNDYRGERIGSEDVNVAAGEHEPSKREELKRDTLEDQTQILAQFDKVVRFCLDEAGANLFLLEKSSTGEEWSLIQELVDLRLIHFVRSRVTVRAHPGKLYEGYILDLSQYAGSRKRRELEIVNFWGKDSADVLRREKLIYGGSA